MVKKKTGGEKKETPLMKQYNAIKAKYPGTVLLFRVGDFYETFGEDAVTVSKILGIVLTKRGNGAASFIELAGFPHHSLDAYLPRLVKAGQRVAVCDQLEDPKQAKGIVKRGVTELVTPGVAIADSMLDAKVNNFLSAFYRKSDDEFGLAFIDVSTADFFCFTGNFRDCDKLIRSLAPSEILVGRQDMANFKKEFGEHHYVSRLEDWVFQLEYGTETLTRQFGTTNLKGYGIQGDEASVIAAGAVIHYLKETQRGDLGHITTIYKFNNSSFVWLDPFSIRNLELLHPSHPDGKALIEVLDQTLTPMGGRLIRRWLIFPLKNQKEIQTRLDAVEAFLKHPQEIEEIEDIFQKMGDLERLISKLATRRILPRELTQLRSTLEFIGPIKEALKKFEEPILDKIGRKLKDVGKSKKILEDYLLDEVTNTVGSGEVIKEGISPLLDELRGLRSNSKDLLEKMREREVKRTGISSLKIGYNRVFGYYLEVTNAHRDKVPDDFIRKQTLTSGERYITPELKEYEDKILSAEEKIREEEMIRFQELLEKLQDYLGQFQSNAMSIAAIDCLQSFRKTALTRGYCKPVLGADTVLDIRAGRHPVIETSLSHDDPYVPNDVFLDNDTQQIVIITGPNMAGKSALLRQTALIVLMAQIGCYVPADEAKIGLVDKIFTRVGASDNISSGESTFMVEMNETARIINNATSRSLILLDEIGRGTSTYDGVSIAWALVEHLHESRKASAKTLFATHYHELNEIEGRLPRVKNYNVSVQEHNGKVIFLRKLLPGGSNHSFGINVARMAGMPKELVKRASSLLQHFESQKLDGQEKAQQVRFATQTNLQLNMFELKDKDTVRIRQILSGVDIDRTPVEALLKLQEIKRAILEPESQ